MHTIKKMKIAIYGDSYANLSLDESSDGRGLSWVDVIRNEHDVTNFGLAGSSVFYSYLKFKEHNEKFDYNVFVITNLDRIYNRKLNELLNQESWYTNYKHIELRAKPPFDTHQLRVIDSVKTYFEYWKDEETENILNFNLIENLRKEHDNNCLFINAFSKGFNPILKNEYGLIDITSMEQTESGWIEKYHNNGIGFGHLDENNRMLRDNRLNHLCEENNIILGSKILDAVNNKKNMLEINLKDFVRPARDIDFYVRWTQK
jgi:hypothetical protein